MRTAWRITKATNIHSEYIILIASPLQQWLYERVSMLRYMYIFFNFYFGSTAPQWVMASSFLSFLDHTQWRTTVGRTPLDEWSTLRRDLYLTTHNTHNRQTSIPSVGFEPTISVGERPQTYALDRAAIGTGGIRTLLVFNSSFASLSVSVFSE